VPAVAALAWVPNTAPECQPRDSISPPCRARPTRGPTSKPAITACKARAPLTLLCSMQGGAPAAQRGAVKGGARMVVVELEALDEGAVEQRGGGGARLAVPADELWPPSPSRRVTISTAWRDQGSCAPTMAQPMPSRSDASPAHARAAARPRGRARSARCEPSVGPVGSVAGRCGARLSIFISSLGSLGDQGQCVHGRSNIASRRPHAMTVPSGARSWTADEPDHAASPAPARRSMRPRWGCWSSQIQGLSLRSAACQAAMRSASRKVRPIASRPASRIRV